jgi:hypothetical protein
MLLHDPGTILVARGNASRPFGFSDILNNLLVLFVRSNCMKMILPTGILHSRSGRKEKGRFSQSTPKRAWHSTSMCSQNTDLYSKDSRNQAARKSL